MTDEDLDAAKALEAAATPGPWRFELGDYDKSRGHTLSATSVTESWTRNPLLVSHLFGPQDAANYAFIAASRTLVPQLLAEIERLQALLDHYR